MEIQTNSPRYSVTYSPRYRVTYVISIKFTRV